MILILLNILTRFFIPISNRFILLLKNILFINKIYIFNIPDPDIIYFPQGLMSTERTELV